MSRHTRRRAPLKTETTAERDRRIAAELRAVGERLVEVSESVKQSAAVDDVFAPRYTAAPKRVDWSHSPIGVFLVREVRLRRRVGRRLKRNSKRVRAALAARMKFARKPRRKR